MVPGDWIIPTLTVSYVHLSPRRYHGLHSVEMTLSDGSEEKSYKKRTDWTNLCWSDLWRNVSSSGPSFVLRSEIFSWSQQRIFFSSEPSTESSCFSLQESGLSLIEADRSILKCSLKANQSTSLLKICGGRVHPLRKGYGKSIHSRAGEIPQFF